MKGLFNLLETVTLLFLNKPEVQITPASLFCLVKNQEIEGRITSDKLCSIFGDKTYFRGDHSIFDECERFMSKDWSPSSIDECTLFLDEDLNMNSEEEFEMMEKWDTFIDYGFKYNKVYDTIDDMRERYLILHDNIAFIEEHNDGNHSYKLGLNQFADWTNDEFKTYVKQGSFGLGMKTTCPKAADMSGSFPSSVDWRQKGIVNAIKDQGQCGSCYTFASIAAIEGADAQKTGVLKSFSEQSIVDCAGLTYGDMGCNGGNPQGTLRYTEDYGVPLESDYPYTAKDGKCQSFKIASQNKGCNTISANELQLTYALSQRVMSIAIQADGRSFQLYSSGVYDDANCYQGQLDHAVNLVGYGHDSSSGKDYYILRNSWSDTWAEQGYMRIYRNSVASSTTGICGLAMMTDYPTY